MSGLFRRFCTRKIFILTLNNSIKNSNYLKPITSDFNPNLQTLRFKSKASKNKISGNDSGSETEDKDDDIFDQINDRYTKTIMVSVPSMRVDTLLKAGLGLSRNKLEVLFYGSNIRVNGEKIMKKSIGIQEGDEIDVIKGVSPTNPDFLTVARVEILSAKGEDEHIRVKIRRCKSLAVENYEGQNKWSQSQNQE